MKRRPRWLIAVFAALAAVNLIGLVAAIRDVPTYRQLNLPFPAVLIPANNGLWVVVFGAVAVGLFRRQRWAVRHFASLVTAYAMIRLGWLALFAASDYDRGRLAFQATITALALIPFWGLWWRLNRPSGPPPSPSP